MQYVVIDLKINVTINVFLRELIEKKVDISESGLVYIAFALKDINCAMKILPEDLQC